MKSLKDLKKEVFEKLSKYPRIEAFFKDSLQERMRINDCWTENALVLILLDDEFFKQSALHTLMDLISGDQDNFNVLKGKLDPKDEYDKKIRDVLAELNAYYHLRKSAFEKIEALPEGNGRKHPDFFAELHRQGFLFEVKNMRAPIGVCNFLFDKFESRRLRYPDIYNLMKIHFKVSANWRKIDLNLKKTQAVKEKIGEWLQETFASAESEAFTLPTSLPAFEFSFENEKLSIESPLEKADRLSIVCGHTRGVNTSDPLYRKSLLDPFAGKVLRIVEYASQRLFEYDTDNRYGKCVLLNWQKGEEFELWFENEGHAIVKSIDCLVKNISENLFVKLLNFDGLP